MTALAATAPGRHGFNWAVELLYNLAALAAVAAFAYTFFWIFLILVAPTFLVSITLMIVEQMILRGEAAKQVKQ